MLTPMIKGNRILETDVLPLGFEVEVGAVYTLPSPDPTSRDYIGYTAVVIGMSVIGWRVL